MNDDVAEVLALERSRLRSLVERDMAAAERIHADDYELITPAGRTHTKATYLGDVASKRLEYLDFEPSSSISVRASPDLIVLRYIARIRLSVGVADDEVELSAWHTDHYEKRDGTWTVVWSQATEIVA
ncbi:nuclear transport factor 2 family protein [Micromonospora sp. DT31]|uniref:nuclear transport factor 2 family protein n=1 Tax=Micromonospora sp. DT31 TaxID=3393434 RepID=UPI003CF02A19